MDKDLQLNDDSFWYDKESNELIKRYLNLKRKLAMERENLIESQLDSGSFPEAAAVLEKIMYRR